MSQLKQVIIAELYLDSGTEYVSGERVRKNVASPPMQVIYSGTVEQWGTIEKTIPCPSGMPQISNARIKISDKYRQWRNALSVQTPRRRMMNIWILPAGASQADYSPVYAGEVVDVTFTPQFEIEILLRDRLFAWLDENIPAMVIAEIYGSAVKVHDEGGFVPIIFGNYVSKIESPNTAQGLIRLSHVGQFSYGSPPVTYDRWALSATPIVSAVIYRKQTVSVDAAPDTPELVPVDESEYIISEFPIDAADNPFGDFGMTHMCVDFLPSGSPPGPQPDGTEIHADVTGIYTRGAWGTLPELPLTSPLLASLNPIDAFINMTFFLMKKAGVSVEVFDTDEISALWGYFENAGLYCSGAITEPITGREWLGQFLVSFNLDMYVNRRGLITLQFTLDSNDFSPPLVPPVFKEGKHILAGTFAEKLPEKVITQIQYRWDWNAALKQFQSTAIALTDDQPILNVGDEEKLEKDILDFYYIRDATTAAEIARRRLEFQSLGSFRQEFEMPLPATIDDVELAQLCKITHSMGLEAPNGYTERQAKILGVQYDLDNLKLRIQTVVYPPVQLTANATGDGRPSYYEIYADLGHVNPIRSQGFNPDLAVDNDAGLGLSNTFASVDLRHANSTAQYAHLHLWGFPEPVSAITSATVHIIISYQAAAGTFFPLIDVSLFRPYTTVAYGEGAWTASRQAFMSITHDCSTNLAQTEFTATFTDTEFASKFPAGASDIDLRAELYQGVFQDFADPYCILNIFDCWIDYVYA